MQRPLLWLPSRARTKAFLILLQKAQCSLPAPGLFVCGTGNQNEVGIWRSSSWVCDLHWRAQWRWQRVLPVSLSCVTGISWALLAATAAQTLKIGILQVGDAVRLMDMASSQWITSHWEESSKSPPGEGRGCPAVTLPWEWGITFWAKAGAELGTPCHILAKMQPQHPLLEQSPLCLPGKQKEWELLLLQNLDKKIWLWTWDKTLTKKFLFVFHAFLLSRVIPSPLPQSSCPHWRGFWFCFQSLQENDNSFSRKPHLVESRFPQWWNDAGSSRSAALVLCQERGVLSLYFRIPSFISALCPNTKKKIKKLFPGSILLTLLWPLMLKWNPGLLFLQVFLGPSWVWRDLWFDKTKMLQETLMWMLVDLRFVLNFWDFLYFSYQYTQKYSCFFFCSVGWSQITQYHTQKKV